MKKYIFCSLLIAGFACKPKEPGYDASGSFEAVETVISAEAAGKILRFDVEEGMQLAKDSNVGFIDPVNIGLQQQQVSASINALRQKTSDASPQVQLLRDRQAVQQTQLNKLEYEKGRIQRLLKEDAATSKQLDDMNAQVEVLQKQMAVTKQEIQVQLNSIATLNRGILSETQPLQKKLDLLQNEAGKTKIVNPVAGTVLSKYAQAFEMTAPGKPLYKIADLSLIILRAYITGDQFAKIRLNSPVTVMADDGAGKYRNYTGTISWISDKAEFTPKSIQTKDERANQVYAIKIRVKNDGYIKIGMYANVKFE